MGFKDKDQQREYQKNWMRKRKETLLANKFCQTCMSKESLVLVDGKSGGKKFSLSYSKSKLDQKLAEMKIMCEPCFDLYDNEIRKQKSTTHGQSKGGKGSTYVTWRSMIERCNYVHKENYRFYGGRGITVCERWEKFENFFEDMGDRPEGMTLDRINPNGNYEKDNCRWATAAEQGKNKRKNYV